MSAPLGKIFLPALHFALSQPHPGESDPLYGSRPSPDGFSPMYFNYLYYLFYWISGIFSPGIALSNKNLPGLPGWQQICITIV
jgi:hypothetical protein